MEVLLIIMLGFFACILILCILNLIHLDFKRSRDKHPYFVDADYRNSLFYNKKDEHQ